MTSGAQSPSGPDDFGKLLGARLRAHRMEEGLSQRELARRIGLSASLISQIESGVSQPSVNTLYAIVTELGVSLDEAFNAVDESMRGDAAPPIEGRKRLVRASERSVIHLESGVRWERLTPGSDGAVDFMYVVYEPSGESGSQRELMRHTGHEYGFVVSGRLHVAVAFDRYVLEPGDAISFPSSEPHRLWNEGSVPAEAIWAVVGRD